MDYFYPLNLSKFKLVLSHKKLSILHMAKNEINILTKDYDFRSNWHKVTLIMFPIIISFKMSQIWAKIPISHICISALLAEGTCFMSMHMFSYIKPLL